MSAMAEVSTAIQVGSLAELPTDRVLSIHEYALVKMGKASNHEEVNYYTRMLRITGAELRTRART